MTQTHFLAKLWRWRVKTNLYARKNALTMWPRGWQLHWKTWTRVCKRMASHYAGEVCWQQPWSNSYIAAIVEPSNRMQVMSALWRRLSWQLRITSHQQTINQFTASVQMMIGAGIRTLKSYKATVLIYQSPCCRPSFQCTRGYPKMPSQNGAPEYQHRMPMKVWTDWFGVDVLKCSTVVTRQCRFDKRLTAICKKNWIWCFSLMVLYWLLQWVH